MVCGVNDVCCFGNVWLSPIQSGLVLLLVGVLLLLAQRRSHRKLAVDLGGENHTDTTDSSTSHYQILHFSLYNRLQEAAGIGDGCSIAPPSSIGSGSARKLSHLFHHLLTFMELISVLFTNHLHSYGGRVLY